MKCTFCGNELTPGTGKMYVKTDGRVYYFCGRKCEKNMLKLKRNPLTSKWTKKYHKEGDQK